MRVMGVILLASSLIVSSAFATTQSAAPLPAGKPSGTKQAALLGPSVFLVLLSAGIVIGGLALAVSGSGNGGVTTPTTSAGGTSP